MSVVVVVVAAACGGTEYDETANETTSALTTYNGFCQVNPNRGDFYYTGDCAATSGGVCALGYAAACDGGDVIDIAAAQCGSWNDPNRPCSFTQ